VARSASGKPQNVTARPLTGSGGGQLPAQSKTVAPIASTSSSETRNVAMSYPGHRSIMRSGKSIGAEVRIWQTVLALSATASCRASTTWLAVTPINTVGEAQKEAGATVDALGPTLLTVMPDYGGRNFQREVYQSFGQGQFGWAAFHMNLLHQSLGVDHYVGRVERRFNPALYSTLYNNTLGGFPHLADARVRFLAWSTSSPPLGLHKTTTKTPARPPYPV
jgi:hypothetical protein